MKSIYPKFETENRGFVNAIVKIENEFLQGLIDIGGLLFLEGDFTLMGFDTMVLFRVLDNKVINLECISTNPDKRKQGSGTKLMNAIVKVAKETNTQINLLACNVTGGLFNTMPHMVIGQAMIKTNKIPVKKLKAWYMKFGFEPICYDKRTNGWVMVFNELTYG